MITREEMENIANLSKLYLSEDDFEKMSKEMDGIINFVNQINTLNDQYNLENNSNSNADINKNVLREDEIVDSFPRNEILKNVDGGKDGFFYVKKFM
ncbi:MAG: Asp-tRNA(Asn)/Glu-tRNA(Gln) amidotransferase subunit GatC [Clostridia bacterium]|nr:Asp-tRNA(Asn)/Glu-tRNA(Gln) amidotransferase subunit GatC [Clostridia bacterium]